MIVGVDAGGTNVDAAAVEPGEGVRATAKRPAEEADVDAVRDVLSAVVDRPDDVERVVVCTTRVLNDLVQDRLPSVSNVVVPGVGLAPELAFHGDEDVVARGCVDHRGRVTEPPSLASQPEHDVVAVTAKFSTRNPDVEREIADGFEASAVAYGSDAGGSLGFPRRAATTVANARSKPRHESFSRVFEKALHDVDVDAPVFYLKGDAAVVSRDVAERAAAQTLRSGPASSSLGLLALSGRDHAVCVDVGGTTTDVTVVRDGFPVLQEGFERAEVETWYDGVDSVDLSLGGDTRLDEDGLTRRRDGYSASYGGVHPTLTDAVNVLGGEVG
ncbi:MAG: hydantoinase/oxoprolinase family protein, partial [Halobacteriota archaeon]